MDRSSRRTYLAGLVGVATLSGCVGVRDRNNGGNGTDQDDEGDDETDEAQAGPVDAVETFYAALDAGRFDVASELLHSETSQQRVTEGQYGNLVEGSVSAESMELIEERESSAVVRTTLRASTDLGGDVNTTLDVELRTENGEWKIYSIRPVDDVVEPPTEESVPDEPTPEDEPTPDSGPGPDVTGDPTIVVREFYAALDDGNRDAANDLIHSEARDVTVTRQTIEAMDEVSLAVENVRLVEEGIDSATVQATVTFSPAGTEQEQSNQVRIELRPEDGRWRIYASS